MPEWVPLDVGRYLEHTEAGRSIRRLARSAGCHPSTVLRQVRKIEARRDDPLVEAALLSLANTHYSRSHSLNGHRRPKDEPAIRDVAFEEESIRILHGMCHEGAVLAVAEGMNKAVVVRDANAEMTRNTIVDRPLAEALALCDWISCTKPCRLSRYQITSSGRTAVGAMIAAAENRAWKLETGGFFETQTEFANLNTPSKSKHLQPRRNRYGVTDGPLESLARLKDRNGQPFLSPELISAGGRLREDFELAQIGDHLAQDRARFEAECGKGQKNRSPTAEAKRRAVAALNCLGYGLSEIALRCCCHLEGLEQAEKQLGWPARSGKVVLRIALEQLKSHYDAQSNNDVMIG